MKKLKIGIIGVGSIAKEHIQAYQNHPDVELYALCDINTDRLHAAGKEYGINRLFTEKEAMLALPELDAVSICTWNSAHAPCAIAALEAGKHVLCEKPMATSENDAVRMLEAARRSGKLLMIGFVRRFGNDCAVLQDFLQADFFGELYYAKAEYLRRNGNPGGWFGDKSRSGGGPLIDLGVHVIDLIRYLMGNPQPISVYGATFQKLFDRPNVKDVKDYTSADSTGHDLCDVEDLASAMIRFDNGAVLSVETAFSLNLKEDTGTIALFGTKAGARLSPELELFTESNGYMANTTPVKSTALDFNGLFQNEINHFIDCIQNDTPCLAPAEDGVTLMRILEGVYQSAASGHEVILKEESK